MKRITPSLLLLASITLPAVAAAETPSREVRVEVLDPGDPSGGSDVTTVLVGEHGCAQSVLDDGTARRELELCADGPFVYLHLKRQASGKAVDLRFAARPKAGTRVPLGKAALGGKQVLEAYVTVD